MTRTFLSAVLTASLLAIASRSAASEQSLWLRTPVASCEPGMKVPDAPTAEEVAALIKTVAATPEDATAYVIHLIDYNADASIRQQSWFVYDSGVLKETDRIFGRKKLKIVSVHRGVLGLNRSQLIAAIPAGLKTQLAALRVSLAAAQKAKAAAEIPLLAATDADDAAQKELVAAKAKAAADPTDAALAAAEKKATALAKKTAAAVDDASDVVDKHAKNIKALDEKIGIVEGLIADQKSQAIVANRTLTGDSVENGDALDKLTIAGIGDRPLKLLNKAVGAGEPEPLLVDENFAALAGLAYRIDITTKTPAPLDNLKSILSMVQSVGMSAAQTLSVKLESVNLCSFASAALDRLPADVKLTAVVPDGEKEKAIGTKTFDDEGKYWYDFAFALPMKSYTDVTIDSTNSTLTAKNVKKTSLFAVASLGLPRDTKKPGWNLPVVIYGLPMSGRAIHHHLTAIAFGFGPVQVFWGAIHNRDQVTPSTTDAKPDDVLSEAASASTPGAPTDVRYHWSHPKTYGVMIQVARVIDLFKKK